MEFDHIYPAFSAFTFGDEGLRPTQLASNVNLGEAGVTTGLPESLQKGSVFLAMGCVFQGSPDYGERLLDIPNWDILALAELKVAWGESARIGNGLRNKRETVNSATTGRVSVPTEWALMTEKPSKCLSDEYWKLWPPHYENNFEPHWAIKIYLDPRGEFDKDSLVPDRGTVFDQMARQEHVDKAVRMFDFDAPGWTPCWLPSIWQGHKFSAEERLAWFDELIKAQCTPGWPEQVTLTEKQRDIAEALIVLLELTESLKLPLPGWLE